MTRHSFFSFFIFLVFGSFGTTVCISQVIKDNSISIKRVELINKLATNNVRKIVQDPYGFIWIGGQDGLSRFDGKEVKTFQSKNAVFGSLNSLDVRDILIDSVRQLIWVLQSQNIAAIDYLTCKVVKKDSTLSLGEDDWNMSFVLSNSKLWIASYRGLKYFDINKSSFTTITQFPFIKNGGDIDRKINTVCTTNSGKVIASFNSEGIFVVDPEKSTILFKNELKDAELPQDVSINTLLPIKADKVLIASDKGVFLTDFDSRGKAISLDNLFQGKKDFSVSSILANKDGSFLFFSNSFISVINNSLDKELIRYNLNNNELRERISSLSGITLDKEGNIWLCSNHGIELLHLGDVAFKAVSWGINKDQNTDHVNGILPVNDSETLVGLKEGFKKINVNTNEFTEIDPQNYYYHIFYGPEDKILVSSNKKLCCYENKKLVPADHFFPELKPYIDFTFMNSIKWNDSTWVLVTENGNGILIWTPKKGEVKQISRSIGTVRLAADLVNRAYVDAKGQLWVLADKVITIIGKNFSFSKTVTIINPSTKAPYEIYFDMLEENGYYWMVVYGTGLLQLDSTYHLVASYGLKEGLNNTGGYCIFKKYPFLFMGTNNGLSVFDINKKHFSNFFKNDGLHGNGFEEGASATRNDLFFAGGPEGFSVINPALYKELPNFYEPFIAEYKINFADKSTDSFNLYLNKIIVGANAQQLVLHLSIPNFINPEKTTYYYRIKEINDNWISNENQSVIPLFKLPPGDYTIEIKAANEFGIYSAVKSVKLVFLPKWYQTWWFKLLIAFITAGIIYAFYRYRISQIKKQHEIRKNIATDLHDDLGSTLNSVKVFTNLAISGVNQNESLQQIKDNLNEATIGLRDMIWVLDDSLDTVDELITRLKQFAIPITRASNMEANIKADSDVNYIKLTKEEKRNLFLVCKESINNSIKYSEATQIDLSIMPDGRKIKITITDNGKGFDVETVKKGYGLKNMQYRAGQVKYKVNLSSAPGKGTTLEIRAI